MLSMIKAAFTVQPVDHFEQLTAFIINKCQTREEQQGRIRVRERERGRRGAD